jgi:hypothetical protein
MTTVIKYFHHRQNQNLQFFKPSTMMLFRTISVFFALVGGAAVAQTDGANTAVCLAQTDEINGNANLTAAVLAYNVEAADQTIACIESGQTSCDLNLDAQTTAVEEACTSAEGMAYTPSLQVTCDNSNTKVTTIWTINYASCIGMNCTGTDELESTANDVLANATVVVNEILNPQGINCAAEVSSAMTVSMMTTLGSIIAGIMVLVVL